MVYQLRLAGYQPPKSVHSKACRLLAARLRSDGAFDPVDLVENITTTGKAMTSLIPMTISGELDVFYMASSYLVGMCASLAILDLPFPTVARHQLLTALQAGALGRRLAKDMAAGSDLRIIGYWDNGVRHISSAVRPIRHPADCQGQRIRTLDNAFHQAVFGAIGFDPVFVDMRDFTDAIATGKVEAQENPLTNLVTFEVFKRHPYVSMTSHFQGIILLLANAAWLEALSPGTRGSLDDAILHASAFQREIALEEDETCLKQLRSAGVSLLSSDKIDMKAFQRRTAPLTAEILRSLDAELLEHYHQ